MGSALVWGALAASSLVIGALLGLARKWPDKWVGLVLAFGAGALVSSVSFELAEEGLKVGSGPSVGVGLAVGAFTYWALNREVDRQSGGSGAGTALALGAFLDGIPEQLVLGIGIATGEGVSVALLVAIFVSTCRRRSARRARCATRSDRRRRSGGCGSPSRRSAARDARRLRDRRLGLGRAPGRDRRVRGRRAAGDAGRLDDPRGRRARRGTRRASSPRSGSPSPSGCPRFR